MIRLGGAALAAGLFMLAAGAGRTAPAGLKVVVEGLEDGRLPPRAAFCAPPSWSDAEHDVSPAVSWSPGPPGTKSYAVIMTDLDVPKDLAAINAPGVTISETVPPHHLHPLGAGGYPAVHHPSRSRDGERRDRAESARPGRYRSWRQGRQRLQRLLPEGSPLAEGCEAATMALAPPNNDLKAHRYVTRVLRPGRSDSRTEGVFFGEAALSRMEGHVLASGDAVALYGPPKPGR